MSNTSEPITIDVVSDVVCPWCFIGKRRLEKAIASRPDLEVQVRFHPYFLNDWVPREGISRTEYLTTKFGSPERYNRNVPRMIEAAASPPQSSSGSFRWCASTPSRRGCSGS